MQPKPALSMNVILVIGAMALLNVVQLFTLNTLVAALLWAIVAIVLMMLLDAIVETIDYRHQFRSRLSYGTTGIVVILGPLTALAVSNPAHTSYGLGLLIAIDLISAILIFGIVNSPQLKQDMYVRKYGRRTFAHGFDV